MSQPWEEEILRKNTERVLSLAYQVTNTNEFEKGIVDDLSYVEDFRIEKTGKEVKEKLQAEMISLITNKATLVAKMESLIKEIGTMPCGKSDRWQMRGFEKYLGEVPRQYSYEQLYPKTTTNNTETLLASDSAEAVPIASAPDKMREFNQVASDYIQGCVDVVKLKTVIDNLPDTKKIKLAPQLAAQLGF